MIANYIFDLAAGRAREEAIVLHIGRMAVKAAVIDEIATIVLAGRAI